MRNRDDMMGQVLKKDYPQVEEFTRIYNNEGDKLIKKGSEFINETQTAFVDSTFFSNSVIFSFNGLRISDKLILF